MTGIKRLKRYYPVEVKLEAVRLFFEGGLTQQEISEKLGETISQGRRGWFLQTNWTKAESTK